MSALVARQGPVGDLLPPVPGGRQHPVGRLVAAGLHVVVRVPVRGSVERRARLDGERIGADVRRRRRQGEHVGQAALPVFVALPCPAQDQIHVPRVEPGCSHHGGSTGHMGRAVASPQAFEHVTDRRLHAEGDSRHPGCPVGSEQLVRDVLGVALDGDLGPIGAGHGVEDQDQEVCRQPRRGAATEEDRRGIRHALALPGPTDLGHTRRGVGLHQMVPVGVGGERAVVTPVTTERHMDVDAEWNRAGHACPCAGGCDADASASLASLQRSSASTRSTPWSTMGAG